MNTIEIWAPKFSNMTVLIKPYRIRDGMNRVVFTKTWRDKVLLMDGERLRSYPIEGHGASGCHAVPVKDFDKEPSKQLTLMEGL